MESLPRMCLSGDDRSIGSRSCGGGVTEVTEEVMDLAESQEVMTVEALAVTVAAMVEDVAPAAVMTVWW